MRKWFAALLLLALMASCSPAPTQPPVETSSALPPTATRAPTRTPAPTATAARTATPASTPTPGGAPMPPEGYGPDDFLAGINPLTGLAVADPSLLERRAMIVKVENLPRNHRPQWGLSKADHVYEYYTEFGTTRFAAVFYGQDADKVGPIRSARWFDISLIRAYKSIFAFGSAYADLFARLADAEFSRQLVLEGVGNCPPMCRFEPNGVNFLLADTTALGQYAETRGVSNTRQDLTGLKFNTAAGAAGSDAAQVIVRFSAAIYNRWDYDPAGGRYLRSVDQQDDPNRSAEQFAPLTDRATGEQIGADNVVVILAPYRYVVKNSETEVLDIDFSGSGTAYAFRDGKAYKLTWQRAAADELPTLLNEDGTPYALKPGSTWFEMIGTSSAVSSEGANWRLNLSIP